MRVVLGKNVIEIRKMEGIGMFPYQLLEEQDLVALKRTEKSLVLDHPLLKKEVELC